MRVNLDRCCAAVNLAALTLLLTSTGGQAADPNKKPTANEPAAATALAAAVQESSTAKIEAALQRKVTLDFQEKPLGEVVAELAKAHDINVLLDRRSLEEASVNPETPITFRASDISLRSALRLMLSPLDCAENIHDEILEITTLDNANTLLSTRCYAVQDLLATRDAFDELVDDFKPLEQLIQSTVAPTTWDEVGGPGSLASSETTLVVYQTAEVHEQLAELLKTLRTAREAGDKNLPTSFAAASFIELDQAQKALLARRVTWHFDETPLGEAMDSIGKQLGFNIRLDVKALEEASVSATTPITFDVRDISFGAALRRLLRGLDLHYVFKHEVLLITTNDKACEELTTRVYPLGGLIDATDNALDYEELINTVGATIQPTTWYEVGGPGAIVAFPPARALVISQTRGALDEIDALMESLRAKRTKRPAANQSAQMVTKVYELGGLTPRTHSQPAAAKSDPKTEKPAEPSAAGDAASPPPAVCPAPAAIAAEPLPIVEIVGLVKEKIAPQSWDGEAKVRMVGAKLIVTQTPAEHRRIARLLDKVIGQSIFSSPNFGGGFGSGGGGSHGGGGGGGFFAVPDGK